MAGTDINADIAHTIQTLQRKDLGVANKEADFTVTLLKVLALREAVAATPTPEDDSYVQRALNRLLNTSSKHLFESAFNDDLDAMGRRLEAERKRLNHVTGIEKESFEIRHRLYKIALENFREVV